MPAIIWRALEPFPHPKKSEDGTSYTTTPDDGTAPMFIVAQKGHAQCLKLLLEIDADPTLATTDNVTVARNGPLEVVKVLLKHGSNPTTAIDHGQHSRPCRCSHRIWAP